MLEDVLKNNDEKSIQKYIEENPLLLKMAVGTPEFAHNFVLPQFQMGIHGRADFIVVTGQSNSYEIIIVELKLPYAHLYTKSGTKAKDLNQAETQIEKYRSWIEDNTSEFRHELFKSIKKIDLDFCDSFDWTRRFHIRSAVFIGRRDALNQAARDRNTNMEKWNINIISYDRLVDAENWMARMRAQGVDLTDLYGKYEIANQYREEVEDKYIDEDYGTDNMLFLGDEEGEDGYHGFYKDILEQKNQIVKE